MDAPQEQGVRLDEGLARIASDPGVRAALKRYGQVQTLRPGRTLCGQGEAPERVWLVVEGRFNRIKYRSDDSMGPLPGLVAGDWCGLAEFLTGCAVLAETVAEDPCLVLAFSAANFRSLRAGQPVLGGEALAQLLARELVLLHHQLADAGPLDRIVHWLLGRRRQIAGSANRSVTVTQAELGRAVGCTRETVNKYLGLLEERGLVKVERRCIGVPDWEALARYQ